MASTAQTALTQSQWSVSAVAVSRGEGKPFLWFLSDQKFSPILLVWGHCVRIIKTDNEDLLSFVLKYGSIVLNRDPILIVSASQLDGYMEYFLEASSRLQLGSRKDCTILPAPFILLGGQCRTDEPANRCQCLH
jgi:hypothetical protein